MKNCPRCRQWTALKGPQYRFRECKALTTFWETAPHDLQSLLAATPWSPSPSRSTTAAELPSGFSQIGSESGWRAAETSVQKPSSPSAGHAQDRRRPEAGEQDQGDPFFHRQGVDSTSSRLSCRAAGTRVLKEAKEAKIRSCCRTRHRSVGQGALSHRRTSDSVHERRRRGDGWRKPWRQGMQCRRAAGPVGASVATNRKKGFDSVVAKNANLSGAQPDRRLHRAKGRK